MTVLNTATWMEQELARFTYKPGWTLTFLADVTRFPDGWGHRLFVRYKAPDSREPDSETRIITATVAVPPLPDEDSDAFAHWLLMAVEELERHEAREWLRRDGTMLFDPHLP